MKRSFLTVAAAAVFAIAACGDTDTDANIEPVDELGAPPPAPAPVPAPAAATTVVQSTMMGDTLGTTTTGM